MVHTGVVLPALYGDDVLGGIERAAAAGVDAVEFFDWESTDLDAVAAAAEDHGVDVAATLAAGAGANIDDHDRGSVADPSTHEAAVADLERSIEAAATVGAEVLITTVGPDRPTVPDDAQHRAMVDCLRAVAPAAEDAGVTVVIEPLNVAVDHPGYYLDSSREAYEVVHAVDSPAVAVLYDVYHQQITEGDVIRNLRDHVDVVGHVHVADNPGRHEPGTGEIDCAAVLGALDDAGYEGHVGLECRPTGDPDDAVRAFLEVAGRADG